MKSLWCWVAVLGCVAGCGTTDHESLGQELRACPEVVRRDESGNPRNAAGHIRQCWPGDAHCFCDRDNDCYAEAGYVACQPAATTPVTARDSGVRDAGARDTGVRDAGAQGASARDAGPLATDNVSYTGSFVVRAGRSRAQLHVAGLPRDVTVYLPATRPIAPPLVLAFHGTNGSGDVMLDESSARAMADRNGAVFIAPDSRWLSHGDWDHATEETYWETSPNNNPNSNPDLLLVRAIIVEAQRRFGVDPRRVYAIGHSSGGFFTELVSTQLAARIAGFATSSAGLVRCGSTPGCRFQGRGTTCAALRPQAGWCGCSGADLPGPMPASGRIPPAYLTHGTRDPLVSVQYTCALAERMAGAGAANRVVLRDGDGHVMPDTFALDAWAFLAPLRLP